MKLSLYERVASLLIALLILLGGTVTILLGLWLSAQALARPHAVPVTLVPVGDGAGTSEDDPFDANVLHPGLEFEQEESSILESLDAVVDIVSENAALFSDATSAEDMQWTPGARMGDGRTRGSGEGRPGPPRHWEVRFGQGTTVDEYAEMLDSFGIELGVLRPGGKVVYLSKLSSPIPTVREGNSGNEKRYYLTQVKGDTDAADRELFAKANVPVGNGLILKFLPPALEAELLSQEKLRAGNRTSRGSFFRARQDGRSYRFELYNQIY